MRQIAILLLGLYIILVAGLILTPFLIGGGDPDFYLFWLGLAIFFLVCQFLFILVPGRQSTLMPVRPRRLAVPAIITGLMLSLLIGGLAISLLELAKVAGSSDWPILFLLVAGSMWSVWTVVFFNYCQQRDRVSALGRMITCVLGGSLLQLLATVPSHIIVTRRPGCMVGVLTGMGLMAGIFVMVWAFGPGIALLFWLETRKRMVGHCPKCGYNLRGLPALRCPECGRPFTLKEVRMSAKELSLKGAKPLQTPSSPSIRCPRCHSINALPADVCAGCSLDLAHYV